MGKLTFILGILVSLSLSAQTYIENWGLAEFQSWPISNDSTTPPGYASIGGGPLGGALYPNNWASLRGSFGREVSITSDTAIIVSGQIEFVGGSGGDEYAPFRYALTDQADEGELLYQGTDSAQWSSSGGHSGYSFIPRTGKGMMANGSGGSGTIWKMYNFNWYSTYSGGGAVTRAAAINQAPYNAEMIAGTYNFAISVLAIDDTTNEISWFLVEVNKEYWFGGSIQVPATTTKFNGIEFGISCSEWTQFNVIGMQVERGNPIDVPKAPWKAYYIDKWGLADYHGWPILNDSTTAPGYAGIGGETRDGWATLRGSFGQDLAISKDTAIVVSGQIEFVGGSGGDDYYPIRYALTHQANEGELLYAGTDSAQWSINGGHSGYEFSPITGSGDMASGAGGTGTVWIINDGSWLSTYSNNGWPIDAKHQSPFDAVIVAGIYDFAISVNAVNDTTNVIRWYMVEEDYKYYFGGTVTGPAITTQFNGIEFGINGGEYTRFNVIAMSVDLGDPIPNPPSGSLYRYIENWGIIGNRFGGWTTNLEGYQGDVNISGDSPNTEITAIRGEFTKPFAPSKEIGIVIQGFLELEGGGIDAANSFRIGVFNSNDAGTLVTEPTDSMRWTGREDKHSGYLFIPPSGTNSPAKWGKESEPGNWGAVVNNVWFDSQADSNYALGGAVQYPANAVAGEDDYFFEISITLPESGGREIRFELIKGDRTYGFAGFAIDNNIILDADSFNCISFALDSGNTITALHLRDVAVGWSNPISLPEWVTSIEQPENSFPAKFSLSQNYPNPFNPVTHINYSIPINCTVSLKVFNLLGQEVATLFEGYRQAGNYEAIFDGSELASGVYFYNLKTNSFLQTRKLILIR